jgi:hypothetical protein
MTTSASPSKKSITSPSKTSPSKGESHSNPVDLTESSTGDKRKAPSTTADAESKSTDVDAEAGKDLVEKKQTTLDDVVSHEAAESRSKSKTESADKKSESKEEDKDGERPSKKSKIDEEEKGDEKKGDEKEEKVDEPIEVDDKPSAPKTETKSSTETNAETKPTKLTPSKPKVDNAQTTPPTTGESTKPTPNSDVVKTPSTTADAPPVTATGAGGDTIPGDQSHLDHPENWATGGDPATDKQKGFLKVLEKQKGVEVGDVSEIGKSEASEKIDELKNMCELSEF